MVDYYNFDKKIWRIISERKKYNGDIFLNVRLREFEINENKQLILYLGDKTSEQDSFKNAWKNRLVVLNESHSELSEEELCEDIVKQFKQGAKKMKNEILENLFK